jgi:quinol monooxygenase YgiN
MSESIIIAGWVDFNAADRSAVLAEFAPVVELTRMEDGCIDYAITADGADPQRIRIFEQWVSDEALAAHQDTDHIRTWYANVSGFPRQGKSILRHVVSDSRPY